MLRASKFMRLPILVSLAAAALVGLVVLGSAAIRAQGPTPPTDGAERLGIRYAEIPTSSGFQPGITAEKAIEVAKRLEGPAVLDANGQISVRLVLFSDDAAYKEDERGQRVYLFRDMPAWVVTFSNIRYPLPGGRRQDADILYATEVHVAIDATNGEGIETYSWR